MRYKYVPSHDVQYNAEEVADKSRIAPIVATYVQSTILSYRGNRYIESLPGPLTDNESLIKTYLSRPSGLVILPTDDMETILEKVTLLRQVRFPLPFHKQMESAFHSTLLTSYGSRTIRCDMKQHVEYTTGSKTEDSHQVLEATTASGTNPGFHIIGYSGCGKSSALETMLSRYPQYLRHYREDGTYFPQIVYLVVSCAANSNFQSIYAAIGHALDQAVGILNRKYSYEAAIARISGLDKKSKYIERLIEQFAIGAIFLDEVQLIDFDSTKSNSIEALMTIANNTKVSFIAIGTEDACKKMLSKLRTRRRLGTRITASDYCSNKQYFSRMCTWIFSMGMLPDNIKLTNTLVDALYKCTGGIIDQLISVFSFMVIDYYEKKNNPPKVDAAYVKKIANKHFPGLEDLIADIHNPLNDAKRHELMVSGCDMIENMKQEVAQKTFANAISDSDIDSTLTKARIKDSVCRSITNMTNKYNETTVCKMIDSVLNTKTGSEMNELQLAMKVMERLEKRPSDLRPKQKVAKKMDEKHIRMQEFLESDNDPPL